jgi:hypothetical protein
MGGPCCRVAGGLNFGPFAEFTLGEARAQGDSQGAPPRHYPISIAPATSATSANVPATDPTNRWRCRSSSK